MNLEIRPVGSGSLLGETMRDASQCTGWRSQPYPRVAAGALMVSDAAAFAGAYALLAAVVPGGGGIADALILSAGVLALMLLARVYPGYRIHPHEILKRRTMAFVWVGLASFVWSGAAVGGPWEGWILAYLVTAGVLQIIAAPMVQRLLRNLDLWGETTQIIAEPSARARLEKYFRDNWRLGVVPEAKDSLSGSRRTVLVSQPLPEQEELELLRRNHDTVVLLADMPDAAGTGLRTSDVNGEIGLRLSRPETAAAAGLRRAADIMVAVPVLICFTPIIAVSAILLWVVDPGPVFFRQAREGLHGRTLRIFKLRTMYRDAEDRLESLLAADPAARAEWQAHFKLRNDPRVLPLVGNFLRSTSCDELPQLLNVIVGDMGLVGPRPFPTYHLAAMPAEFRKKRASVLPGMTGLWQISARSEADVARAQQLDEFYIDNRSLWLDLSILLKTFGAVVRRTGAY